MGHPPVDIRDAEQADAGGIAAVHVASWRHTYRDLMPDSILESLDPEQRAVAWREIIANSASPGRTIVALREGRLVGWASYGPGRDPGSEDVGELWALYAHPNVLGTGVGHALMATVEERLSAQNFRTVYLWVLEGNERAAAFYDSHGYRTDGTTKHDERMGMTLIEICRRKTLSPAA